MTSTKTERDNTKAFWIMALMALYVLSPVDIIPDVAPGLGNLDDLLVMLFASKKAYAPAE